LKNFSKVPQNNPLITSLLDKHFFLLLEGSMFSASDWEYDTSSEDSTSIAIFTGAGGKLFFINTETEEHLDFKYSVLSVGAAKGAVFNVAKSLVSTASGGLAKVRVRGGFPFSVNRFPCKGIVICGGLTAGVFTPSFIDDSGLQVSFLGFGINPLMFAWVPVWGRFSSILPSGGVSLGIILCEQAQSFINADLPSSNIG
jgi:hypothetical protein